MQLALPRVRRSAAHAAWGVFHRTPRVGVQRAMNLTDARRGFTLIELVIVLLLTGILSAIALPMIRTGHYRTNAAVQELALGLNSAQRLAVLRQHDIIVTFLPVTRTIRTHYDANNNGMVDSGEETRLAELPETIGFGPGSAPKLPEGPGLESFDGAPNAPALVFHRNGSASESGVVYLRPIKGAESGEAGAVRALAVERSTGIARCFSYQTLSWEDSC